MCVEFVPASPVSEVAVDGGGAGMLCWLPLGL